MGQKAELRVDGRIISLDVLEGSEGERAIDIRKLRDETGLITLDPGYANTGSCESAITFIDGEQGILRYRGYDIAELAERAPSGGYLLISDAAVARGSSRGSIHPHELHETSRFFAPARRPPDGRVPAAVGALHVLPVR
jgi:citrate synthase